MHVWVRTTWKQNCSTLSRGSKLFLKCRGLSDQEDPSSHVTLLHPSLPLLVWTGYGIQNAENSRWLRICYSIFFPYFARFKGTLLRFSKCITFSSRVKISQKAISDWLEIMRLLESIKPWMSKENYCRGSVPPSLLVLLSSVSLTCFVICAFALRLKRKESSEAGNTVIKYFFVSLPRAHQMFSQRDSPT